MMLLKRAASTLTLLIAPPILMCAAFAPLASFQRNRCCTSCEATLGFLSFDLDDTLFSTAATVDDANKRQIACMNELFDDIDFSISSFQETTRHIRRELTEPVTYTTLRKLAIRRLIEERSLNTCVSVSLVDHVFDVWLEERHAAAERHLFEDTIATLKSLKINYPDVCMAAITNGRGNPLHMPNTLAPYFDFCVSGEDGDVFPHRKPAAFIYETALQRYHERFPHHRSADVGGAVDSTEVTSSIDTLTDRVWCHVGDCLANDVGASAACGAFAVWYNPNGSHTMASSVAEPSWSTATQQDIEKRQCLAIEAETKVATRISKLSELEDALQHFLRSTDHPKIQSNVLN